MDTPILDNFNRANEGPPPGPDWITAYALAGLVTQDNECRPDPNDAGDGAATWNHILGPNAEVYVTLSHIADMAADQVNGMICKLCLNLQCDDPWICNGMHLEVYYDYQHGFSLWLDEHGQGYVGGTNYFTMVEGDGVKVQVIGYTAKAFYRHLNGPWQEVISGTINNPTAGYPGLVISRYHHHPDWFPCVHFDDFGGGPVSGISAPTGLEAHIAGNEVSLSWSNVPPEYTYLTVERALARDGPWTDLGVELEPDAETATDDDPGDFDLWYHVYVENDDGDATTPAVQAEEHVRKTWDEVAHEMGIPDLAEPVAPFTYGEAGEQLFLVCCRLWRLEIAPDLPDPVLSKPEDWREFIETGTFPT